MHTQKQLPFRITSLVFGIALALAVGAWALYAYIFHSVSLIGQNSAALRAESDKLEHQQSQVLQLKRDLAANQARQPVLVSYFVEATDPVPLFETVEGYGRTTNVAVSIDSVDIKRAPDRLLATLTGTGSFVDLYRFIALLEAAPYEFSVADATLHAKAEGAWEARITLSIASVTGVANIPIK
jgi:Tfp pilus assembly protein PilN